MRIYNSLTRKFEEFKPLKKGEVTIYVCGITPEGPAHLGHAFTNASFDGLIRYLKYKGFKINYTQNVTDIDDDILRKAKEQNRNWQDLGNFWTDKYLQDLKFLNVLPPTHYVKASDSIRKIMEMVDGLVNKNLAYEKEGNVYFDVAKFQSYGKLSKFTKQQMILISKERGADPSDPLKKNPLDFILWQKSKLGEPSWDSLFGKGRPGWHIECSAMINQFLGQRIDIHGGGRDLIYPHHESEIAQSESFTDRKPFVKYWVHIGMVMYEGEKMAKSLGNLVLISDLAKKYSSNAVRWLLLSHHYRKPWEFDEQELKDAENIVVNIQKLINQSPQGKLKRKYFDRFEKFMDNDLDTEGVLKFVSEVIRNEKNAVTAKKILEVLGFDF